MKCPGPELEGTEYGGCPAMPVSWRGFEKAPKPMLPIRLKPRAVVGPWRNWYTWWPWFPVEEEEVEEEEAEEDSDVMDRWPCPTSMESCVEALLVGEL